MRCEAYISNLNLERQNYNEFFFPICKIMRSELSYSITEEWIKKFVKKYLSFNQYKRQLISIKFRSKVLNIKGHTIQNNGSN